MITFITVGIGVLIAIALIPAVSMVRNRRHAEEWRAIAAERRRLWERRELGVPDPVPPPTESAVGLLERMMRLLPVNDRPRYRLEYLAELHILAEEGASPRAQLGYVLRAVSTIPSLRRALRSSRPGQESAQ